LRCIIILLYVEIFWSFLLIGLYLYLDGCCFISMLFLSIRKKTPAYDLISYFYVILYTITEKYKP